MVNNRGKGQLKSRRIEDGKLSDVAESLCEQTEGMIWSITKINEEIIVKEFNNKTI